MIASLNYQIIMKLLLDQGLPRSAAPLLREEGIDTIHVTPFPLEEHGSFLALSKAFTRAFRLYSYGGKGVVK
jgi:hypothetical protein